MPRPRSDTLVAILKILTVCGLVGWALARSLSGGTWAWLPGVVVGASVALALRWWVRRRRALRDRPWVDRAPRARRQA